MDKDFFCGSGVGVGGERFAMYSFFRQSTFKRMGREGGEASIAGILRWAGVACVVLGAIFLGVGLVRRSATEMAVTNKRVIVKSGLADRRTIELLLPRIESIAVEEPALGRLLGYGTVIVRGTGGTPEVFPQIARPLQFREQVQRQIAGEPKSS